MLLLIGKRGTLCSQEKGGKDRYYSRMNAEKLAKMQAAAAANKVGGKGTPRRKVKIVHKTAGSDAKKLEAVLKKLGANAIAGVEEVRVGSGVCARMRTSIHTYT